MGGRGGGQRIDEDAGDEQHAPVSGTSGSEVVESGTDPEQERVREVVGRRGYDENDDLADENKQH